MSNLFVWIGYTEPFQLFSISHIIALSVLFAFYVGFIMLQKVRPLAAKWEPFVRNGVAVAMIVQEIFLNIYRVQTNIWSFAESLPVHLCSFSIILGSYMLVTKSKYLFDVLYFWSAGAMVALFTPDLTNTDFPTFRFYQFFFSHGLIIFSVLYMFVVHGYRPAKGSLKRVLIFTHFLVPFIAVINYVTGGNYFFIAYTPPTASPIDLLGPWPQYLIWLDLILISVFSVMYLPFAIDAKRKLRMAEPNEAD